MLLAEIKRRGIPPLYAQENNSDPTVYLELQVLNSSWRWYVTECEVELDRNDVLFFGYVVGFEKEWGYFRLSDLKETGRPVLVSSAFEPVPFSELKRLYDL
jgi:hypothetical protein